MYSWWQHVVYWLANLETILAKDLLGRVVKASYHLSVDVIEDTQKIVVECNTSVFEPLI